MSLDITAANAYFGAAVHSRSVAWTSIPQARRIAALVHAARLIASRMDDDLKTDTTVDGAFPRHDAAVFEQALWMLESEDLNKTMMEYALGSQNHGGSFSANMKALRTDTTVIAPAALRFLYVNPRSVRLSRGL